MSERDIRREFERHTYKPGYTLSLDWGGITFSGSPIFTIRVKTANSYRPGEQIKLVFTRPLPPMDQLNLEMLRYWLHHTIVEFEAHEAAEWHRIDGEMAYDPHNTDGR